MEQVGDTYQGSDIFLYPENIMVPKLSNGQRITLAYNYDHIEQRAPSGEFEADELIEEEGERLQTSFPKHDLISKTFENYVKIFEKPSSRTLATEEPQAAIPASNLYNFRPGFQFAPTMEQWQFKSHLQDIPQIVEYDGDIAGIKFKPNSPLPKTLVLREAEWGNLQKSASHSLRAISHLAWYKSCTKNAIDMALQNMDPNVCENAVQMLKDAKQFIKGLTFATDLIAKMSVYQHAGVTSSLRHSFLMNEGNNIPTEEKMQLYASPYGSSLVFQGRVASIMPRVKQHRNEVTADRHLAAALRIGDAASKSGGRGGQSTRGKQSTGGQSKPMGFQATSVLSASRGQPQPMNFNQSFRGGGRGGRGGNRPGGRRGGSGRGGPPAAAGAAGSGNTNPATSTKGN